MIESLNEWLTRNDYWAKIDSQMDVLGIDKSLLAVYKTGEAYGIFIPKVLLSQSKTKNHPAGYVVAGLLNENNKFHWLADSAKREYKKATKGFKQFNSMIKREQEYFKRADEQYKRDISEPRYIPSISVYEEFRKKIASRNQLTDCTD